MSKKDQFRLSDDDTENKVTVFVADLTTNAAELGAPTKAVTSITTKLATYKSFNAKTKDKKNRTSIDIENKNVAKKDVVADWRADAKQYYYDNSAATSIMVMDAGLRPHAGKKAAKSDNSIEIPNVSIDPAKAHKIEIECLNSDDSKAKPDGISIIRVKLNLGTPVPTETEDFPKFQDFSKHPIVISFKVADAGKPLAIAVCYVKKDGTEGNCCDVIFTTVP